MNTPNPPELFDGGYWYVVDAIPAGGMPAPEIPGIGWCASYIAGGKVLLRTPDAIALSSFDSAANAEKFRARIRGR